MEQKTNVRNTEKIRLVVIVIISIAVIVTGALFAIGAFRNGDAVGGVLGIMIALISSLYGKRSDE